MKEKEKFLGAYFMRALLIYWQRFSPWPKPSQELLSPSDTKEHVCPEDDVQKRLITHAHVFFHVSLVQRVTAAPSGRRGSDKDAALGRNARRLLWVSYHQAPTWAHREKTWTKTNIISNSSRLHPLGTLGPSKCLPQKLKADWRTDYGLQRALRTGSQLLAYVWQEKPDRRQTDGAEWTNVSSPWPYWVPITCSPLSHLPCKVPVTSEQVRLELSSVPCKLVVTE